jgi:hypothetical protein
MDLEKKKLEILSILGDIEHHTAWLKAHGIDASDPDDREAYDIVCRIERRLLASPKFKKESVA